MRIEGRNFFPFSLFSIETLKTLLDPTEGFLHGDGKNLIVGVDFTVNTATFHHFLADADEEQDDQQPSTSTKGRKRRMAPFRFAIQRLGEFWFLRFLPRTNKVNCCCPSVCSVPAAVEEQAEQQQQPPTILLKRRLNIPSCFCSRRPQNNPPYLI